MKKEDHMASSHVLAALNKEYAL